MEDVLMVARWTIRLIGIVVIIAGLVAVAAQETATPTPAPGAVMDTRTYLPPDSDYQFTYPLDSYSVRAGCTCETPNQGQDILFPGVTEITPNDSLIYRDGQGVVFRIRIAVVAPEAVTLDSTLFGTGPLVQYEAGVVDASTVQEIEIGGVPALRLDDLPVGAAGLAADIMLVHNNLLYEITVEPVNPFDEGGVKGRNLVDEILASFEFIR
jgi:hypothetical protein